MQALIISVFGLFFAISPLAFADGEHEHRPVVYTCQADDGATVFVEVKGYAPLEGSVQVVTPNAVYNHPLKAAGHEDDELGHLYFTFETPGGDATVLIGTAGETLDGALLSPYGDHALTCHRN